MIRSALTVVLSLSIISWPSFSWAEVKSSILKEGDRLYRAKCSSCHRLLPPQKYPMEKWQIYVDQYGKKLKKEEKNKILEYLKEEIDARSR